MKLSKKLTVLNIGCFSGCTSLKEIVIPSNIKCIEQYAFSECSKMKKIKFQGNGMTVIGEGAFDKIHPSAVFDVKKKAKKLFKRLLDESTGYKKSMKIV